MAKQIQIRIFPDGTVKAETHNIKGKQCLKYIAPLEELLEARTEDSEFTKEYYEAEGEVSQLQETEVVNHGR